MQDNITTTLLTAGIVFVAAAIIGGGLKAFNIEIPLFAATSRQVLLALFGFVLIIVALNGSNLRLTQPNPESVNPSPTPKDTSNQTKPDKLKPNQSTHAEIPPSTSCIVTVKSPLVELKKEPAPLSRGLTNLPPGEYPVLSDKFTTFVSEELHWFKIEHAGYTGWVQDSVFFISEKTDACRRFEH